MQSSKYAIKELYRCKKERNLAGIEIGTNINDENLNNNKFLDFFTACEELSMAIFVHPWQMMGMSKMKKYWLPWLIGMPAETSRAICSMAFGGIFEKFPKVSSFAFYVLCAFTHICKISFHALYFKIFNTMQSVVSSFYIFTHPSECFKIGL